MVCTELLSKGARRGDPLGRAVTRHRFDELHEEGRGLVRGWAQRALTQTYCSDRDCFEPFIFGWIALNGWACCVTEQDRDSEYLDALSEDKNLHRNFENALAADLMTAAREFQSLWPIFSSKHIGYHMTHVGTREEVVAQYRAMNPARAHRPSCAFRHLDKREEIPLDWPHTLSAIYQVRCNLFHGYKGLDSENDVLIVAKAFRVLVRLLPMLITDVAPPSMPR